MTYHILVVDDDPDIRTVVEEALSLEDCAVVTARNGQEALARMEQGPPRVILLDIHMPVLDGVGVARALRARGHTIPVVVMTAGAEARRKAAEVGAAAYLAKPFDLDRLVTTVRRFAPCPPDTATGPPTS